MCVCRRIIKTLINNQNIFVEFQIFKDEDKFQPLLGLWACEKISLVIVKDKNFHCTAAIMVEQKFNNVFNNKLDRLSGVTSLQLRSDAVPVMIANRRMPISYWLQLKAELKRLTKKPVTTNKKDGSLRICLDPMNITRLSSVNTTSCLSLKMFYMTWKMLKYLLSRIYFQDIGM